jgi:hypothetical protein
MLKGTPQLRKHPAYRSCKKYLPVFAETVRMSNAKSEVILQKIENIAIFWLSLLNFTIKGLGLKLERQSGGHRTLENFFQ